MAKKHFFDQHSPNILRCFYCTDAIQTSATKSFPNADNFLDPDRKHSKRAKKGKPETHYVLND